ncbi:MAG: rhodanese-like domain-containing protein [Verrucomicrobiota bacterium]
MIRRMLLQSAVLLALTALAGALTWHFHPERPELYLTQEAAHEGEITVLDALARQQKDGVVWLDARQAAEYRKGHIPGAMLLNEYDWENLLTAAFEFIAQTPDERPVIIYCDGQKCAASHAVRKKLQETTPIGDREILVLRGGFPAWEEGDYPIEQP